MIFGLGRIRTTDTKNCNPRMLGFHQERRQAAEIYHRTTIAISGAPPSLSPERHHHRHRSPIHPRSKLDAARCLSYSCAVATVPTLACLRASPDATSPHLVWLSTPRQLPVRRRIAARRIQAPVQTGKVFFYQLALLLFCAQSGMSTSSGHWVPII
jgi:hypothetical protein